MVRALKISQVFVLACVCLAGCGQTPPPPVASIESLDPPAAAGAMAPNLAITGAGVALSWIEPEVGPAGGHALRLARLGPGREQEWGEPRDIVRGPLFANWADFPSVLQVADGSLIAHWLERSGEGTYSYDVQLGRSDDGGSTWRRLGPAHHDGTRTEHGFVSMIPEGGGARLFWLDGREMAGATAPHEGAHGAQGTPAMTLRTARVSVEVDDEEQLDARVCDCCQTAAGMTAAGPVVVYRDRSESEVRDIGITRAEAGVWTAPRSIHADEWVVPGCPVNGPSLAVHPDGRRMAVAWFTAPDNSARVQVAFSGDAGLTFGEPVVVDSSRPLGRVSVLMDDAGDALVLWLGAGAGEQGALMLGRTSPPRAGGIARAGPPVALAEMGAGRSSGFPRMVRLGDELIVVWTEGSAATRLRGARVPVAMIPPVRQEAPPALGRPWDGRPGAAMPAYEAFTQQGVPVQLGSLRGKPVLLNFWATWCKPCREEMPILADLHRRHAAAGLQVVGVSVDEARMEPEINALVESLGIPYTILRDQQASASRLFDLAMLPSTFLFDGDGRLVWSRQGVVAGKDPDLDRALAGVLAPRH